MEKKSTIIFIIIGILIIGGLFVWPKINDPNRELMRDWKNADIECLPSHTAAAQHIHPVLRITVDGAEEGIPENKGIVTGCMAEVHTHDTSGTIHAESVLANKKLTLGQFMLVLGQPLMREGFDLEMSVNGTLSEVSEELILRDKQEIVLTHTSQER